VIEALDTSSFNKAKLCSEHSTISKNASLAVEIGCASCYRRASLERRSPYLQYPYKSFPDPNRDSTLLPLLLRRTAESAARGSGVVEAGLELPRSVVPDFTILQNVVILLYLKKFQEGLT